MIHLGQDSVQTYHGEPKLNSWAASFFVIFLLGSATFATSGYHFYARRAHRCKKIIMYRRMYFGFRTFLSRGAHDTAHTYYSRSTIKYIRYAYNIFYIRASCNDLPPGERTEGGRREREREKERVVATLNLFSSPRFLDRR